MSYQMIQAMETSTTTTPSESNEGTVDLGQYYAEQFGDADSEERISAIESQHLAYPQF